MAVALFPTREYKITPRLADAANRCLLCAMTPTETKGSQALAWGNAIHTLVKIDARRRIAGRDLPDPEDLVMRGTPRAPWRDDPDYLKVAHGCVVGMRAFIDENDLEVLRAEEFVRTNARTLKGSPDVAIVLSGRIDLVCRRPDGRPLLLDMKTGNWLPSDLELAALPSTVIYTLLGHELRHQNQNIRDRTTADVEVAQIIPHLAAYASVWLTEDDLVEGRSMLRHLVRAIDAGNYPATRGEWCAYCPLYAIGDCPAWAECHTDAAEDF